MYNKTSCFKYTKFTTKHYYPENINITTELKWKLFIKVTKELSEKAWVWIGTESN